MNGATLILNEAKDDNQTFSIVHITDDEDFICKKTITKEFKDIIICSFPKAVTPNILESNRDFVIKSISKDIKILPKSKVNIYKIQDNLLISNKLTFDIDSAGKHWIIVGYKNNISLLQNNNKEGLDFDIEFQASDLPFVGSLGLDGLPITQRKDASQMSQVRSAYENKDYEKTIQLSDNILDENSGSFSHESKLYKIRAMDKLAWIKNSNINQNELMDISKEWIEENPSSRDLPEVLMYIAKVYYKLGHVNSGDNYTNILKEEFKNSKFTLLARLHRADRLYEDRKSKKEAIKIYKDILYETNDIDIATTASIKLSQKYLEFGRVKKSKSYYEKILDANELYIQKHIKESYGFAKSYATEKEYDLAIKILSSLLTVIKDSELKDDMSKNIAYWYELSGDKAAAFALYRQYLKEFKNGKFVDFVKQRLDKGMLDVDEKNITKKMKDIDNILTNYKDDPIYKKALLEKAKIYVESGQYGKLFELESELRKIGGEKFLASAALIKIGEDLKNDNCKDAIYLAEEYNVTAKTNYEKKFYECLMRYAQYDKAMKLAQKHLEDTDMNDRLDWMYKTVKVYTKLDKNKSVIMLGEDVEKLSKVLNTSRYNDIIYEKANAYYNLDGYDELMLREVKKIERVFSNDIRNVDLFSRVLRYAKNRKDDLLIVNYAQKLIKLQKLHKIKDYTPIVELDYINALKRLKRYDKALKVDINLLYKKLNDVQRANVLYIAGELSLKTNKQKEAREFFIKCGNIVEDSSWQRLCAESLKLLEE